MPEVVEEEVFYSMFIKFINFQKALVKEEKMQEKIQEKVIL